MMTIKLTALRTVPAMASTRLRPEGTALSFTVRTGSDFQVISA